MSGADNVPPPASYQTVYTQQPAGFGDRFGATPGAGAPGITVRPLRDTQEDADFAGRLVVDAFRGKIVYAAGERNVPALTRNIAANHRGQDPSFYNRTFVAEYEGRSAGILQLKFKGDKEHESDAHLNDLGCWAAFGLLRLSMVLNENVARGKCYLDHIAVDEGFRGKGIGKVLMEKAEYEARMRGCSMIYLYVVSTNRAKSLYERQGYVVTSEDSCCCCLKCCLGEKSAYCMEKPLR